MSPLVLLSAEADPVLEEKCSKRNIGRPLGSCSSKVVLTLVTKVVTVYVRLSAVYVRGTGLQLLPVHLGDNGSWGGNGSGSWGGNRSGSLSFQNDLKNPLQVIFRILGDINSDNRGFCP